MPSCRARAQADFSSIRHWPATRARSTIVLDLQPGYLRCLDSSASSSSCNNDNCQSGSFYCLQYFPATYGVHIEEALVGNEALISVGPVRWVPSTPFRRGEVPGMYSTFTALSVAGIKAKSGRNDAYDWSIGLDLSIH